MTDNAKIHGIRNSYARVYAENHGIAFAEE